MSTNSPLIFALFFLALLDGALAQHANCSTARFSAGTICRGGGFILPTNFNVAQLDVHMDSLTIAAGALPNEATNRTIPLPAVESLREVYFHDFNHRLEYPFNFSMLLANNKQLRAIHLYKVKVDQLSAGDFRGFRQLERFTCVEAVVNAIDVHTFAELGALPSGEIPSGYQPVLAYLVISVDNYEGGINQLDWSFLKPVSKSMTVLSMKNTVHQMITIETRPDDYPTTVVTPPELTVSSPFRLIKARYINLEGNHLRKLPEEVYGTFDPDLQQFQLRLGENDFCHGGGRAGRADCGCCEMADFIDGLRRNGGLASIKSLACVGSDRSAALDVRTAPALTDPYFYSHCKSFETALQDI